MKIGIRSYIHWYNMICFHKLHVYNHTESPYQMVLQSPLGSSPEAICVLDLCVAQAGPQWGLQIQQDFAILEYI